MRLVGAVDHVGRRSAVRGVIDEVTASRSASPVGSLPSVSSMKEITTGRSAIRVPRHADRLVRVVQAADPSLLIEQIKGGEARQVDFLVEDQGGLDAAVRQKYLPIELGQVITVFGHGQGSVFHCSFRRNWQDRQLGTQR